MRIVKQLTVVMLLAYASVTSATTQVAVDETYCDGVALMAKAGIEAKRRGETLLKWQDNLKVLQGIVAKHQDDLLAKVLPKAIKDSDKTFNARLNPTETYIANYDSCMAKDYGRLVTLN